MCLKHQHFLRPQMKCPTLVWSILIFAYSYPIPRYAQSPTSYLSGLLCFRRFIKLVFCIPSWLYLFFFFFWMFIIEETDDFYEFTAEDYHRILATKKQGNMNDDPILLAVMLKDKDLLTLHHFWSCSFQKELSVILIDKYYLIGGPLNGLIYVWLAVVKFGTLN